MGLDMYLNRAPKYKDTTIEQINAVESYLNWNNNPRAKEYTLKKWCGVDEKDLPSLDVQDYYKQFFTTKYYYWDKDKQFGHGSIREEIGYWRKANAIHKWFVDKIQDGEDDCGYYKVDKDQLEELLKTCKIVKDKCNLIDGQVSNGQHLENGKWVTDYEDGQVIENKEIAEELLPTQGGFFFGSTDYDEWYMRDIDDTITILEKVLAETNFENQIVFYSSSW